MFSYNGSPLGTLHAFSGIWCHGKYLMLSSLNLGQTQADLWIPGRESLQKLFPSSLVQQHLKGFSCICNRSVTSTAFSPWYKSNIWLSVLTRPTILSSKPDASSRNRVTNVMQLHRHPPST